MDYSRHIIERGDRVFARLTMGGRTLVEFMMNRVSSIEEVISELSRMSGDVRGLARLYVRNQSRGWSEERGLMVSPRGSRRGERVVSAPAASGEESGRRMLFPWETH